MSIRVSLRDSVIVAIVSPLGDDNAKIDARKSARNKSQEAAAATALRDRRLSVVPPTAVVVSEIGR